MVVGIGESLDDVERCVTPRRFYYGNAAEQPADTVSGCFIKITATTSTLSTQPVPPAVQPP